MTDIFSAIKIADDLEKACLDTIEAWFPVYVKELEIQHPDLFPVGSLPAPKSFLTADRIDRSNADLLPAIVAISPGLSGKKPAQEGDGSFRAFFHLGVGVFVVGSDRPSTKRLVRTYTAICRTIMLQKQSLGGFADGSTWLDESYDDDFNFTDDQTIGAGQVVFEVEVDGVVNRYGGPAVFGGPPPDPDPVEQPGSDWPTADVVTATVQVEE
jgi:hypothetical protein